MSMIELLHVSCVSDIRNIRVEAIEKWMDGWMHACMDAWMHACMDAWMHGCMDAWMHGCKDAWIHGCMDAWMALRVPAAPRAVAVAQLLVRALHPAGLRHARGVRPLPARRGPLSRGSRGLGRHECLKRSCSGENVDASHSKGVGWHADLFRGPQRRLARFSPRSVKA